MDDIGRCVCGMKGQKYILGPCILSGRLLIHADKKTRLFVEGSSFSDGVISWRFGREYPEKCQHFLTGSALLTDIEMDLCPQWREGAVAVKKEDFESTHEVWNGWNTLTPHISQ